MSVTRTHKFTSYQKVPNAAKEVLTSKKSEAFGDYRGKAIAYQFCSYRYYFITIYFCIFNVIQVTSFKLSDPKEKYRAGIATE